MILPLDLSPGEIAGGFRSQCWAGLLLGTSGACEYNTMFCLFKLCRRRRTCGLCLLLLY
jgi:hypothetical protein